MGTGDTNSDAQAHGAVFATTHWSVVLAAGEGNTPQSSAALEQLCRTYWYPLYAFVRRRGYGHEDAQDLTQGFFAHLLRKDFLDGVGPEKGRFRSFLLACLKHFLADEWQKARTAKRGGDCLALTLPA
jgi:DNA-directed RNA polymerase specialized sigma24 family protein